MPSEVLTSSHETIVPGSNANLKVAGFNGRNDPNYKRTCPRIILRYKIVILTFLKFSIGFKLARYLLNLNAVAAI